MLPSSPASKVLLLIMAVRLSLFTEMPFRATLSKLATGWTVVVVAGITLPRRSDFGKNGSRPKSGRSTNTDLGMITSATLAEGAGAGARAGAARDVAVNWRSVPPTQSQAVHAAVLKMSDLFNSAFINLGSYCALGL